MCLKICLKMLFNIGLFADLLHKTVQVYKPGRNWLFKSSKLTSDSLPPSPDSDPWDSVTWLSARLLSSCQDRRFYKVMNAVVFSRFDVHRSMHRNIFLYYNQQDAPVSQIIYSCKMLYMIWTACLSIIRSSIAHMATGTCQTAAATWDASSR